MKKVVYILGAARSGSTLLDIVLGNSVDAFSCGELFQYPKRRGIPHGWPDVSERDAFWQQVEKRVRETSGISYDTLKVVTDKIERHASFFYHVLPFYATSPVESYHTYVNLMFDTLFESSGKSILIDSSKRPSRALALNKFLQYSVYVIYLIRNPVHVIRSFAKKDVEQASKTWLSANIYYFFANFFSSITKKLLPEERFLTIYYENLLSHPVDQLTCIENKFLIDLSHVKDIIISKRPLEVGYLFDGNRIRMQNWLRFNQATPMIESRPYDIITSSINWFWWNERLKTSSREALLTYAKT